MTEAKLSDHVVSIDIAVPVHSGWTAGQVKHHKGAATGWAEILDLLKQDLETGDIPLKWKLMYAMMNGMLFMMPSRTKVEKVDRAGY